MRPTIRVLLVDDERPQLELLGRWLGFCGFEAVPCASAEEALAAAALGTFDVIVTDLRMPGLDGARLLGELRAIQPAIPALVLSGQSALHLVHESLVRSGPTKMVQKPVTDLAQLSRMLIDMVDRTRHTSL